MHTHSKVALLAAALLAVSSTFALAADKKVAFVPQIIDLSVNIPTPMTNDSLLAESLAEIAQRPGIVKTRNQLMDAAYQDDIYVDDRTIDSHIKRVCRKFRQVDPEFDAIETLYGAGYRFSDE